MRVYEGSPRQDYEEVLRSIGAYLDQRGMREILLAEAPDGFIVQGLVVSETSGSTSDSMGRQTKDTLTFLDDDISRFMEDALARRKAGAPQPDFAAAGYYERALRVIGRYIDQQKPRDVFFFEQDRAFVLRLLMGTQTGARHVLAEFTGEEIETMVEQGPTYRAAPGRPQLTGSQTAGQRPANR
jgi:hypothetical protein